MDGILSNLKTLSQKPENKEIVERALSQLLTDAQGTTLSPASLREHLNALTAGNTAALRETLLAQNWGRLSQSGKQTLMQWFQQQEAQSDPLKGTQNFDRLAWERIAELEKTEPLVDRESTFIKERLKLSLSHLGSEDSRFIKAVDEVALDHGLTSVVHLKSTLKPETTLIAEHSRQTLLKELKYFLEHFVDRASDAAEKAQTHWAQQRPLIHQTLFAPSKSGWRGLLPHAEEGLVTAALKAKTGYTIIPIGIAIGANFITTFMNNYITQKKHLGRVFFPGEEAAIKMPGSLPIYNANPINAFSQNGRVA